jgi:hypothetical protein
MTASMKSARILAANLVLVTLLSAPALGQSKEFWPELDVYVKINEKVRLYFSAAGTRENGGSSEGDFGAHIDFHLKPLVALKQQNRPDHPDESKSKLLLLRTGFHYLPKRDGANESRIVVDAIPRVPLKAGVVGVARGRVELRFIGSDFSWRYRHRIGLERTFSIRKYDITPYARAEFYYDRDLRKWSRTALTAGCVFPIRKRSEIEAYYEHQNRTETSPNRQLKAVGVQLNLYF